MGKKGRSMNYEEAYFGKGAGSSHTVPEWSIPDKLMHDWTAEWIDDGFIKEYLNYTNEIAVTPAVYHVATVLSIVSYALSECRIEPKPFKIAKDGTVTEQVTEDSKYHIIPVLWSAIVGESGDRKSTATYYGKRILREAIKDTDLAYGEAPDIASPEALTEHMAEHGPVFTFRDELSTMLTRSKRNHMEHMKPLLLQIYDHISLTRRKAKDTSKRRNEDEEGPTEAYQVTVEKPIKMILGCIPPRVFATQTSVDDWDTGLLPRFTYWPGYLDLTQVRLTMPYNSDSKEQELARTLRQFFIRRTKMGLRIIIPYQVNHQLAEWVHERINPLRHTVSGAAYAYLKRSYTTVVRIAAIIAAGEIAPTIPKTHSIIVKDYHADAAIALLDHINPKLMALFDATKLDRTGSREEALLKIISNSKNGVTIEELLGRLDDAPSRSLIDKELQIMEKSGLIHHKMLPTPIGRDPKLYYVLENKTKVCQRVNQASRSVREEARARSAARQKAYRARKKQEKLESWGRIK
jgi:hypothetical protein